MVQLQLSSLFIWPKHHFAKYFEAVHHKYARRNVSTSLSSGYFHTVSYGSPHQTETLIHLRCSKQKKPISEIGHFSEHLERQFKTKTQSNNCNSEKSVNRCIFICLGLTFNPAATWGGVSTICLSSEELPRFRSITGARTVVCFVLWLWKMTKIQNVQKG